MRGIAFAIALVLFAGALFVMRPSPTGDEPHYALEAISIVSDGDRDLADEYDEQSGGRWAAGSAFWTNSGGRWLERRAMPELGARRGTAARSIT